jgi:hypothetical protein
MEFGALRGSSGSHIPAGSNLHLVDDTPWHSSTLYWVNSNTNQEISGGDTMKRTNLTKIKNLTLGIAALTLFASTLAAAPGNSGYLKRKTGHKLKMKPTVVEAPARATERAAVTPTKPGHLSKKTAFGIKPMKEAPASAKVEVAESRPGNSGYLSKKTGHGTKTRRPAKEAPMVVAD